MEPVALFLSGEVADVPGDAVHRQDTLPGLFVGHAFEPAPELAAGEP